MRFLSFALMFVAAAAIGCNQPTETLPTVGNDKPAASSGTTDDAAEVNASSEAPPSSDGASLNSPNGNVRFVANKKLEVPGMSCPYGCYPTVEKALAKLPGVQGVQLAQQPEGTPEGEIALKVVELKVGDDFQLEKALAALNSVSFEAAEIN